MRAGYTRYSEGGKRRHPLALFPLERQWVRIGSIICEGSYELSVLCTLAGGSESSEGIAEQAVMGLSWLLVPSTNVKIIRAALEEDMRREHISQHDIDVTVSYLAGGMEDEKYRVRVLHLIVPSSSAAS